MDHIDVGVHKAAVWMIAEAGELIERWMP